MRRGMGRFGAAAGILTASLSLSAVGSAAEPVTLTFVCWIPSPMFEKYVEFANSYMKRRFPQVTVQGTTTWGTQGNYNQKILTSLIGGAGPDLYFLNLGSFETEWVKNGFMLPIDGLLDKDPRYKADLHPAVLEAWRYNGQLYALPTTIGQYAIYFNRDHLNAVGLGPPPADWTITGEFQTYIRRLTRVGPDNKPIRRGFLLEQNLGGRFMNFILSNGGHVVDETVSRPRTAEPAFVDTVAFFADLAKNDQVLLGSSWPPFLEQQVSLYMSGIFHQPFIQEGATFDWGVARLPRGTAGRQTVANSNAWVVNPASHQVDLAWELAKGFSSAEFARFALTEGLEFPIALSALRSAFFDTLPKNLSRAEGQIWIEAMDYIRPFPKHPLMTRILSTAQSQVQAALRGRVDARSAGETAASQIQALINEYRASAAR